MNQADGFTSVACELSVDNWYMLMRELLLATATQPLMSIAAWPVIKLIREQIHVILRQDGKV